MKPYSIFLFVLICFLLFDPVYAQKGKDRSKTITAPNTIVNEFTTLISNATAGSSSILVANATLNSNGRFPGPLASGDLVMIIQMQGAGINGNATDSTWGEVTSYNNCGLYEMLEVSEVSNNNTINLSCPLQRNYTSAGKVQVIRVPRYSSLVINSGGVLTTEAWNGSIGGVISIEVSGAAVINKEGSISVTGLGFRGGGVENTSTHPSSIIYASPDGKDGGEKGESIAGYQIDYDAFGGRFSRGAPANGGGGGNAHNAGGGGGANAGIIASYTGNGNPGNIDPAWFNAWNLEYNGFAASTSSGGGRGGYTFAINNEDAITVGPGNPLWGGDERNNVGGKGGRPLDYSTGRLFLGGGGGSGDANDGNAGGAGAGGGLVYLLSYGSISGNGTIDANGEDGLNTTGVGIDAAGGAGGGGTVILNATGKITGITVKANGGNGGNQIYLYTGNPYESEGPGGGGGGGYIAISNGNISRTASGGKNGTTSSPGVSEFNSNGATNGGEGFANETITNFNFKLIATNDTICPGERAFLAAGTSGTTPPNTIISWYNAPVGGSIIATGTAFTTPVLTQTTTYYLSTCPGLEKQTVTAVVVSPPVADFTAFPQPVSLFEPLVSFSDQSTGATSWHWSFGDGDFADGDPNPEHTYPGDMSTINTYLAQLIVFNEHGCSDTIAYPIEMAEFTFYVPNSFTPNNDGINDFFFGTGIGIVEYEMWIFDRWGMMIFYTDDLYHTWDGKVQNGKSDEISLQDVYVWKVKLVDVFGEKHKYNGHVSLIR